METRSVELTIPADPANLDSEAKVVQQAGRSSCSSLDYTYPIPCPMTIILGMFDCRHFAARKIIIMSILNKCFLGITPLSSRYKTHSKIKHVPLV